MAGAQVVDSKITPCIAILDAQTEPRTPSSIIAFAPSWHSLKSRKLRIHFETSLDHRFVGARNMSEQQCCLIALCNCAIFSSLIALGSSKAECRETAIDLLNQRLTEGVRGHAGATKLLHNLFAN